MKKMIAASTLLMLTLVLPITSLANTCTNCKSTAVVVECHGAVAQYGDYMQCPKLSTCQKRYVYYHTRFRCTSCGHRILAGVHNHFEEHTTRSDSANTCPH